MHPDPAFDRCEEPVEEHEPPLAKKPRQFVLGASGAFNSKTQRGVKSETVAAFVDVKVEVRALATVRRYDTSIHIAQRALGLGKLPSTRPVRVRQRLLGPRAPG